MIMRMGWLAIALLACSGTALAEDMVVIESSSPAFAVGSMVADGKAIDLPAGARLVLVGASGRTVPVIGPYKGTPGAGGPGGDGRLMMALASLVQPKAAETGSIGAVRALKNWRADAASAAADVWTIDIAEGGTQCLADADPKQAALVKSPILSVDTANLMNVESGSTETLAFAGKSRLPWPAAMPLADGQTYLVEYPGQSQVVQITLQVLPPGALNEIERAVRLAELGCSTQAQIVLALLKKSAR